MTEPRQQAAETREHEQNLRDLRMIREDPGWALTAVQEWRRLHNRLEQAEAALRDVRRMIGEERVDAETLIAWIDNTVGAVLAAGVSATNRSDT